MQHCGMEDKQVISARDGHLHGLAAVRAARLLRDRHSVGQGVWRGPKTRRGAARPAAQQDTNTTHAYDPTAGDAGVQPV
jgi:hypothetical protein